MVSLQDFENDVSEFNQKVEDLDQRLGTIFIQAFDDAPGLEHAFKVCVNGAGATRSGQQKSLPTFGVGVGRPWPLSAGTGVGHLSTPKV